MPPRRVRTSPSPISAAPTPVPLSRRDPPPHQPSRGRQASPRWYNIPPPQWYVLSTPLTDGASDDLGGPDRGAGTVRRGSRVDIRARFGYAQSRALCKPRASPPTAQRISMGLVRMGENRGGSATAEPPLRVRSKRDKLGHVLVSACRCWWMLARLCRSRPCSRLCWLLLSLSRLG